MKRFKVFSKRCISDALLCGLLVLPAIAFAAWTPDPPGGGDPYTSNASIFNENGLLDPLLPEEFGGHGTFCFQIGNNSGTEIGYNAEATSGQLVKFTVSVANGRPDTTTQFDPVEAVAALATHPNTVASGFLNFFDVIYTAPADTSDETQGGVYSGTQKAQLDGNTSYEACFPYLVTNNKFDGEADPKNGSIVNIQRPAYLDGNGDSGDNNEANSYSFVSASDYGDAPASYGEAVHEISLEEVFGVPGLAFMYLGTNSGGDDYRVDPEGSYQGSPGAYGDDLDQTGGLGIDDEDGVSFDAALTAGQSYDFAVSATVPGFFPGNLNAWIAWNADGSGDSGSFAAGQQIATNLVFSQGGGSQNISVTVPAGTPDGFYYARFRFGPAGLDPTTAATFGEVEDYLIVVGDPTAVTIGKVDLQADSVKDFLDELSVDQMGDAALRDILRAWDPELAATLVDAGRDALLAALQQYLDPDGDGQVAVLHWDTLEERGTVGFYVERSDASGLGATLINNHMLPGLITAPMGGEYMLADPVPTSGNSYQYRFIEQEATGNSREYGPYNVEMP